MKALFREMAKVQQDMAANEMPQDPIFKIKHVVVDAKMVVIHTTMQSKSKRTRGFRQIHMFRFKRDKVIEYWDVTQMVPKDAKYPKNMF